MSPTSIAAWFDPANALLTSAAPMLALAAFLLALLALVVFTLLERRLSALTHGKNGTIEETLALLTRDMKEFQAFRTELEAYLKIAEMRLRGSVQGIGIVRFNPFQGDGSGGNQSFAIALLDEFGHGVVLSTLYARDRVGVYCKPIEGGKSLFETSDEERQAIEQARKHIADHKKK
ncbi:MAG: DUF4446 family protein [Patescibacteria group bacterium]